MVLLYYKLDKDYLNKATTTDSQALILEQRITDSSGLSGTSMIFNSS